MKSRRSLSRILALFLALTLLLGMIPTAFAAETSKQISFEKVESTLSSADLLLPEAQAEDNTPAALSTESDPDEMVRVSIVMEKQPVLSTYSVNSVSSSSRGARSYRESLLANQYEVQSLIEEATGEELDVVWNLTLATNVISANVRRGDLDKIAETWGVAQVVEETLYYPCETEAGTLVPNMTTATTMTGADLAWTGGYTGAGSRIAIIDTGLDTDHQSLNNDAFLYALGKNAEAKRMSLEAYKESLNLLDAAEIEAKLDQLNIAKGYKAITGPGEDDFIVRKNDVSAKDLFVSDKIPFAYNYYYSNYDVGHTGKGDYASGHGSHVAGIAAANRYIETSEDVFEDASTAAHMVGTAPDAQLLAMRVFSKQGGCADSDYMAAIEDAIVLGCDVINLSLGSTYPGFTQNMLYPEAFDTFAEKGVVLTISAGNSYSWAEYSAPEYLYAEDVSLNTVGSPGSYANAFTVASVDNCGNTAATFAVDGKDYAYGENQQESFNELLSTLDISEDGSGTPYGYIFMDSLGHDYDFEEAIYSAEDWGLFEGKIVFVSRGDIDFATKHEAAEEYGAAACVIYNNEPGTAMNMNLSTSDAEIPCVSITKADAEAIREASAKMLDAYGDEMEGYYTGTMTVKAGITTVKDDSGIYTMSQFSSWGVPGNLTLKPEITTPGGNIYSIDGETNATDKYIAMGGTSMAAPHAAGLTAILAQYIREQGLTDKLNISPRVLAQSLLMSTATPVMEGALPYSLLKQGAGLANVNNAMNAASYVTMSGQPDGKVKAELGDDPNRTGVYTFDFTLHNMTGAEQIYNLSADVYTQNYVQGPKNYHFPEGETAWFMDYAMKMLQATTTFKVNGVEATSATLPADGEVTVTVTITLTADAETELERIYTNGAYIEAYVKAMPQALSDGTIPSAHSIPVLAFYGGWDEPSMFDSYTHTELMYGKNEHASYIPAGLFSYSDYNNVVMQFGDTEQLTRAFLGGNLYAKDDEYLPARNAIRSDSGDSIVWMNFCPIRNAPLVKGVIANEDGTVYGEEYLSACAAHMNVNAGDWEDVYWSVLPGAEEGQQWKIADGYGENAKPLPEGTTVNLTVQAAPDYYIENYDFDKPEAMVDWDKLNPESTSMSLQVTVDNTDPEIMSVDLVDSTDVTTGRKSKFIDVTAQDNRYIAAVLLMSADGTKVFLRQSPNQTVKGADQKIRLNITDIFGDQFKLVVVDYAGNNTEYDVELENPNVLPTATLLGAYNEYYAATWHSFSSSGSFNCTHMNDDAVLEQSISGAAYGGGYVFYVAQDRGDYYNNYLYALDYPDLTQPVKVGSLGETSPKDMTYNPDDGYLYFAKGYKNSTLYRLDPATAEQTAIGTLYGKVDDLNEYEVTGLAYHTGKQCFYAMGTHYNSDGTGQHPTALFKFTLPESGDIQMELVQDFGTWPTYNSMLVLDEAQNVAFIRRPGNQDDTIFTYVFETGALVATAMTDKHSNLMLLPDSSAENTVTTETPASVTVTPETVKMFVGETTSLTAEVGPWCLKNKSVAWTSSDESVVTVNNGQLTAKKEGTATITATSTLDETIFDTCAVTVLGTGFTFQGVGTKNDGSSQLFTYDLGRNTLTTGETVTDKSGNKIVSVEAVSAGSEGAVWMRDSSFGLHLVDPATGVSGFDSSAVEDPQYLSGIAYGVYPFYGDELPVMLGVDGKNARLFFSEASDDGSFDNDFTVEASYDLSAMDAGKVAAIAAGPLMEQEYEYYTSTTLGFYALDVDNNQIIRIGLDYSYYFGWAINTANSPINNEFTYLKDSNDHYQDSLVYDFETGTLLMFHVTEEGTKIYALNLDANEHYNTIYLGKMESSYKDVAIYAAAFTGGGETPPVTTYTVAFDSTGGSSVPSQAVPAGSTAVKPQNPSRDGFSFAGWYTDSACTVEYDFGTPVTVNLTLYAKWEVTAAVVHTVTFMDGGMVLKTVDVKDGETVESFTPTKSGYKFQGWYTDLNSTIPYDFRTPVTTDLTLYARWNSDPYEPIPVPKPVKPGVSDGSESSATFVDVPKTHWAFDAVEFVAGNGWFNGVDASHFNPNGKLTRAMLVTVLWRMEGKPEAAYAGTFDDVPAGQWYTTAVEWAAANGVVNGTGSGFDPNGYVTREQIAAILWRLEGKPTVSGGLTTYPDGTQVSDYAKDAMIWAVKTGLFKGDAQGNLNPRATATRAEAATLLQRFSA